MSSVKVVFDFFRLWVTASVVLAIAAVTLAETEGELGFYAFVPLAPFFAFLDAFKEVSS